MVKGTLQMWLNSEIILDYPGGCNVVTRVLKHWKREQRFRSEKMWGWKQEPVRRRAAGFEGGGRGHRPRDEGCLQKLQWVFLQSAQKEHGQTDTSVLPILKF